MHSGDPPLHCNLLTCRRPISALAKDHAVVTTCSHVFCEQCATAAFSAALVCPACETPLPEPEDIALTTLNPTERYKSSVLSGLPPSVIHDIAGRALSFWVYQISQECALLELTNEQADTRIQEAEARLTAVTAQSNQDLAALRDHLRVLEQDRELDRRRLHDLTEQCAEKSRELSRLQVQMDHVRRKSIVPTASGSGGPNGPGGSGEFDPADLATGLFGRTPGAHARDTGGGHVGVTPGMHWTTATGAGGGHSATTGRPWNLTAAATAHGANSQARDPVGAPSRMPATFGAGIKPVPGPLPATRSGRSGVGPSAFAGSHLHPRQSPGSSRYTHSEPRAAAEWIPHQSGHRPQAPAAKHHQQVGRGQRRSSKPSGGQSQAGR